MGLYVIRDPEAARAKVLERCSPQGACLIWLGGATVRIPGGDPHRPATVLFSVEYGPVGEQRIYRTCQTSGCVEPGHHALAGSPEAQKARQRLCEDVSRKLREHWAEKSPEEKRDHSRRSRLKGYNRWRRSVGLPEVDRYMFRDEHEAEGISRNQ